MACADSLNKIGHSVVLFEAADAVGGYLRYGASARSQMLKYHIQTSGRSLHAQEIQFNDIRTTLQALYALFDNCNSLHTNAYDEAITTPTEESVRRALAVQLIINREWGLAKNENPYQGSFIVDDLTDTGKTAGLVRAMLPKAHFATVYAKPAGRPVVDTFITEVSGSRSTTPLITRAL